MDRTQKEKRVLGLSTQQNYRLSC